MKCGFRFAVIVVVGCPLSLFGDTPKLDMNDVSWLWPVPRTTAELDRIISMDSLKTEDGNSIWSSEQFGDFIKTAQSDAASVDGMSIDFQDEFRSMKTWHIVAFRADPSAPGGHGNIRAKFGERPQLRLIVQPLTRNGSSFTIHDVTLHLVYTFMEAGQPPTADRHRFARIVADLDALKALVEAAGVVTSGKPLGVHPGLRKNVDGLDRAVRKFLENPSASCQLSAMALMGLDGPEPWIFLAMSKFSARSRPLRPRSFSAGPNVELPFVSTNSCANSQRQQSQSDHQYPAGAAGRASRRRHVRVVRRITAGPKCLREDRHRCGREGCLRQGTSQSRHSGPHCKPRPFTFLQYRLPKLPHRNTTSHQVVVDAGPIRVPS